MMRMRIGPGWKDIIVLLDEVCRYWEMNERRNRRDEAYG
jgi:hypothetical protein